MDKDKKQIGFDFVNKKWFAILVLTFNAIVVAFCLFALIPLLYFLSESTLATETILSIYSIDWTMFGIFIAIAGILVAITQNKDKSMQSLYIKNELVIIIFESIIACLMLFVTSVFIFSGNTKLFMAATFATLYLLVIVFGNYICFLTGFVLDKLLVQNKTE